MSNVIFKTAVKLEKAELAKVTAFAKSQGVNSLPEAQLDEKLIAGFILEIDGTEYDYSVRGALSRLGKSI